MVTMDVAFTHQFYSIVLEFAQLNFQKEMQMSLHFPRGDGHSWIDSIVHYLMLH